MIRWVEVNEHVKPQVLHQASSRRNFLWKCCLARCRVIVLYYVIQALVGAIAGAHEGTFKGLYMAFKSP